MITLDKGSLLVGGVSPKKAMNRKIGAKVETPARPVPTLEGGKFLVRGGQAHGAKIGQVKEESPR